MIHHNGRRYSAVVLDWYLTLIEYERMLPSAAEIIRRAGYHCADALAAAWLPEAFDGCETPSLRNREYQRWRVENLTALTDYCEVPPGKRSDIIEEILATESAHVVRARDGAEELLRALRARGLRIGVCSNWDYPLDASLEAAGLAHLVDAWVTSSSEGARKPHQRIFQAICSRLDVPSRDALHCGDSWSADVVGALRAGLTPIWITTSTSPVPRVATAASLGELRRLLLSGAARTAEPRRS